jgi:hypothetical protein
MTYEVQHNTLCDGWINCWTQDDKPMTFATEAEAQAEIDDFLSDIEAEIASGDRAHDEGYDPSEFRIVNVADADDGDPLTLAQIEAILIRRGYIVTLWSIEDVQTVRPDLTDAQCRKVLERCQRYHDAEIGLNFPLIEMHADDLFPKPDGDDEDEEEAEYD